MIVRPRVSVLMTTFDGARTIGDSVASIIAQDMRDFELIVVDDHSADQTPALLAKIDDSRLTVLRNDARRGIANARNRGLAHCRAAYIAALDHDDLSDPRRLRLQADYLDAHPDIVLVGSSVQELRGDRLTREDQPRRSSPGLMRLWLHLDNPLAWSSVMVRAAALRRLEPPFMRSAFEPADDFDLYHRLLEHGGIARIDLPLTTYRWHAFNATHTTAGRIADGAARVLTRAYAPWFGAEAAEAAALVVRHGSDRIPITDPATAGRLRAIVHHVAQGVTQGVAERVTEGRPAERSDIAAGLRQILWRLTRASIRSGHPLLFRPPAPVLDAAISLAIGLVRTSRHITPK